MIQVKFKDGQIVEYPTAHSSNEAEGRVFINERTEDVLEKADVESIQATNQL
jgi:hypothetical protein